MSEAETTPYTISVLEDEEHFLVKIPPPYRERAKKLAGRGWSTKKRAWIYDKTYYNYRQIYEEFHKDAVEFGLKEPARAESEERIEKDPKESNNTKKNDYVGEKIDALSDCLNSLRETVEGQRSAIKEQSNIIESLRDELKTTGEKSQEATLNAEMCNQFLREAFNAGIGEDVELENALAKYDFFKDQSYVLNRLEELTKNQLRSCLDIDAEERMSLNNLIQEANDTGAIVPQTRGHLDTFRRQRNSIVHDDERPVKKYVRYISAITALSLAWNDIKITN